MSDVIAKLTLSEDFYTSYWRESIRHRTRFRRWTVPLSALLIGLGVTMIAADPMSTGVAYLPVLLITVGMVELIWHFWDKARWFRAMRTRPQANGQVELRFGPDGIIHCGPTASGKIEWCGIQKIIRTDEGLFLVRGRGASMYIPFTSLPDRAVADTIESLYRARKGEQDSNQETSD